MHGFNIQYTVNIQYAVAVISQYDVKHLLWVHN